MLVLVRKKQTHKPVAHLIARDLGSVCGAPCEAERWEVVIYRASLGRVCEHCTRHHWGRTVDDPIVRCKGM